jgi:hypothetical protein
MSNRTGPISWVRFGLALAQTIMGLVGASSVIVAAHTLFLRYYAREWSGIQFAGVNDCVGEDMIANGDLLEGKTFCNQPENFVPWFAVYRHHWQVAALYYGAGLMLILLLGLVMALMQSRLAPATPFGAPAKPPSPGDSEHLR